MAVADVMRAIAMEIHVAPPSGIFDPDALGMADGRQARGRNRLMQEVTGVFGQQMTGPVVEMGILPGLPPRAEIDLALSTVGGHGHAAAALGRSRRGAQGCSPRASRRSINST